jgi:DNA-binding NarL/FixJ family response regulator
MVLFVVDDLFFSIKIKTAARLLNADVYFERSGERTLETIREKHPHLVVFDLDSAKLHAIETVKALKADSELCELETLGFVSHVHSDTIAAARAAGIDQVLARSAFSDRLGAILSAGAKEA